jgi:hypothetical protein
MPKAPSRPQIEAQFNGILSGTVTRDEADRWAAQWVCADDPDVEDELVWWALTLLYGINLRPGPEAGYLHDDEQVVQWLTEFRAKSKNSASGGGYSGSGMIATQSVRSVGS